MSDAPISTRHEPCPNCQDRGTYGGHPCAHCDPHGFKAACTTIVVGGNMTTLPPGTIEPQ